MLTARYSEEQVRDALIPRDQWHPFPTAGERPFWDGLPGEPRAALVRQGEALLDKPWPLLPAVRFLDYARDGNRTRYEALFFARRAALCDLVLAECVEGRGRFLDEAVNGIWLICEESFWGVPAHVHAQKAGRGLPDTAEPTVDLFAAETAALLAWTVYLLADALDRVSPLIVPRVRRETERRILSPLLERCDFAWMGFGKGFVNNWNPWIVSNWLAAALVLEPDPARRAAAVFKAMRTVDHFIDAYPADGGCDEGPGYWGRAGASLYEGLEWLRGATAGRIDVYDDPRIRNIGRFIYRVQIADRYFINFADAPPLVTPDPGICFGFGRRIGDPALQALGAWAARRHGLAGGGWAHSLGRRLPLLGAAREILAADPAPPLPRDVFLPDIQLVAARDRAGSADGFFMAAKGGHNAESHNHNDVGHVIVFLDGKPILVDAGVQAYTAKTFSAERYTIWTMQSAYHALPTINGRMQEPGRAYAAREVEWRADDGEARFALDLAGAYPAEAAVRRWHRTVTLRRGREVVIEDVFALDAVTGPTTHYLLTACTPETESPGRIALREAPLAEGRVSGAAVLEYDAARFTVAFEPVALGSLEAVWGARLTRMGFTPRAPAASGAWRCRLVRPPRS